MILYEGRADTKTFLMGTGRDEADGRDAIVHQFLCKFAAGHSRVAYGKVEAVGNGTVKVFVIDDMEVVLQENPVLAGYYSLCQRNITQLIDRVHLGQEWEQQRLEPQPLLKSYQVISR